MSESQSAPDDEVVLEGHVSVLAALEAGMRPVRELLVVAGNESRSVQRALRLASGHGIPVQRVDVETIAARASGKSHGGLLAVAGPRTFQPLHDLAAHVGAFVVMLDGVEDPFNFGQAVRALYAAGATGLVVRPRNWFAAGSTVARASAGASERIPTSVADGPAEAAATCREHGLAIACTVQSAEADLYQCDLTVALFLLVGGERRGVTRSFREQADLRLGIPYGREFRQSLGSAAAAAVIGFEVMRQRRGLPQE